MDVSLTIRLYRLSFYRITLKVNTVSEIWPVYVITKEKCLSKNYTRIKNQAQTLLENEIFETV